MLYQVPDKWTEDAFNSLPDEDDRYEYKSGKLIDDVLAGVKPVDKLEEDLAKEVGALVNSFGGTLFIGAKDKTKVIDGCPIVFKGKETTKEWLEKKIPEWFEFRLYSFRVNYVLLNEHSKKTLGDERELIHIDIWDSGFLPHQVKKSGLYYYRESSVSRKAPHYYLSYLWASRTPTMSEKVRKWCLDFLNPLIESLKQTEVSLRTKTLVPDNQEDREKHFTENLNVISIYWCLDIFVDRNLAAKQFFYVFPDSRNKCLHFFEQGQRLRVAFLELCKVIENTGVIEQEGQLYIRQIMSQYPDAQIPNEKEQILQNLVGCFQVPLYLFTSSNSPSLVISKMIAWHLIGFDLSLFLQTDYNQKLFGFSKNIADRVNQDFMVIESLKTFKSSLKDLEDLVRDLHQHFDAQRDQLTATHSTTYF